MIKRSVDELERRLVARRAGEGAVLEIRMKSAHDATLATPHKRKHEPNSWSAICSRPRYRRSRRVRSDTNSPTPSCRSPRMSMTLRSRTRRSTRTGCAISPAAPSSLSSGTSFWLAGPHTGETHLEIAIARSYIAQASVAAFLTPSTGSRPRPDLAVRGASPII